MHPLVRRTAAVLAAPALSLTALAATSSPAGAAVDPTPATASATWLSDQLVDGLAQAAYVDDKGQTVTYADYGLSIDVALGLDAIGGHDATIAEISDAVAAQLGSYIGTGGEEYAGATAKAAVLAQTAGDDPTAFGGVDLIDQLTGLVVASGPATGRIKDASAYGDYANTLGQSFAVMALDAAGDGSAAAVTDFLLDQQCSAGFFRQSFTKDVTAADQSCDGASGSPDVDSTALAVRALQSQGDDPEVAASLAKAVSWLESAQETDGSFGADAAIPAGNANSTGLAGFALGLAGKTDAAARAAAWLRAHQATNVANCVYYATADLGAVAYDDAARKAGQTGPIGELDKGQWVRATAQALPALQWAPAGAGEPHALFAAEYVRAGGFKPVGVIDAAPGEALCAMLGEQSVLGYADQNGEAQLKVRIPATTGKSRVSVANAAGSIGKVTINALGKKKLELSLRARIAPGAKQVLTVRGLAPGEQVSVTIEWPAKRGSASGEGSGGQANAKGVFVVTTKVPNRPGKATVTVRGQFANRKAAGSFTVTR